MNKEWVDRKNKEYADKIEEAKIYILEQLKTNEYMDEDEREECIEEFEHGDYYSVAVSIKSVPYLFISKHTGKESNDYYETIYKTKLNEIKNWSFDLASKTEEIVPYYFWNYTNKYDRYLDSEPIEFDGDIIITDPCYIINDDSDSNDWKICDYGSNMEVLGFTKYITRDTIYGDWSCNTFNTDTNEVIGHFCADAGLVSVFLLDEVLKYNPDYDDHINATWTTTWIKDFKGTVQIIVKEEKYKDEINDSEYTDYEVEVVGHGVNKVTGEPINFVGKQTGF